MSRIGKVPIPIPKGVTVSLSPAGVGVKGPKGELSLEHRGRVKIVQEDNQLLLTRPCEDRQHRAWHGLYQRLISNMIKGVTDQFRKDLEIQGIGYRAAMEEGRLVINVGYSHPIYYAPPQGIAITTPKPTEINVVGIDKQAVGQAAAEIRRFRPPDSYKGKGIRYQGEHIRLKEGKTGAK